MQNLRVIRRRIRSIENTQKITRAMQMVAGAKLKKLQGQLTAFKPYSKGLKAITQRFLAAHPTLEHPLVSEGIPRLAAHPEFVRGEQPRPSTASGRTASAPVGLVVVTSDTGLCGTYNDRVLSLAESFLREHPSSTVLTIGKKGSRFLARREIHRAKEILGWGGRYPAAWAQGLLSWIQGLYLEGEISSWWVAATEFISSFRLKPTVERFLPIERPASPALPGKVITEPAVNTVAKELLERFLKAQFAEILLSAFTAEHSARMIAMKNATDNAGQILKELTLVRNKVRQAAITKELIEVVSGAGAF